MLSPRFSQETLAEMQHNIWSHWMNYMFTQGTQNEDGSWTMPKEKVDHWKLQAETQYRDLSKREQDSDKDIVTQFIFSDHFSGFGK